MAPECSSAIVLQDLIPFRNPSAEWCTDLAWARSEPVTNYSTDAGEASLGNSRRQVGGNGSSGSTVLRAWPW